MRTGTCKLTGTSGKLVKSHIIPDAFMKRALSTPYMEFDGVNRPKRYYSGWYDKTIVTECGEKVLGHYDNAAADFFGRHRLMYRYRRNSDLELDSGLFGPGIKVVEDVDTAELRLFALSLLWRCAASSLEAFSKAQIPQKALDEVAEMILSRDAGDPLQFPVFYVVLDDYEELPKIAPYFVETMGGTFLRIFLDGVVAYVAPEKLFSAPGKVDGIAVGTREALLIGVCDSRDARHRIMAENSINTGLENFERDFRRVFRGAQAAP